MSWLWQTWQETAPSYQTPRQRPQKPQTSLNFEDEFEQQQISETGVNDDGGGLSYAPSGTAVCLKTR